MKKLYLLFFVFIMGCNSNNYEYEKLNQESVIVAFGDSLTYGYGSSKSYPEFLEEKLKIKVINEGINGDTTSGGLDRIEEVIKEHKPNLIIIGLGGNDFLRKKNKLEVESNLEKMIEISKANNVAVVIMPEPQPSLLNIVSQSSSLGLSDSDIYEKISKKYNVLNMDSVISNLLSKEENKSDLIHLNEKGYELLAEEIENHLKDNQIID